MTHTAHIPAKRWQVIEGETPPEWLDHFVLYRGEYWAWQSYQVRGRYTDWLYQLPDGTIGTCTDEMAAKMFCEPYEEAARVADELAAQGFTGQAIAKRLRSLGASE